MKKLTTVTSFLLATGLCAQLWAPPGAEWNYNIQTIVVTGCQNRIYEGDTLIGGRLAQRFHVTGYQMDHWHDELSATDRYFHTSVEDSIVFGWTALNGQWEWDTLYWFNAVLGDRWWPIGMNANYCGNSNWGIMQVTDTGHVLFSGQELRVITVTDVYEDETLGFRTFEMTERFGSPLMTLPLMGCIISEYGATLRTYSDDGSDLYDSGEPSMCDLLFMGLGDGAIVRQGPVPYPNPGSEQLRFAWLDNSWHGSLLLCDAMGRNVLQHALSSGQSIDVSSLPPGIYYYMLNDTSGRRSGRGSWTKQ